jgi:hypothetical protein
MFESFEGSRTCTESRPPCAGRAAIRFPLTTTTSRTVPLGSTAEIRPNETWCGAGAMILGVASAGVAGVATAAIMRGA